MFLVLLAGCVSRLPADQAAPAASSYQPVAIGANQRVWQRDASELGADGKMASHTHQYIELGTGLNYWNNGQWLESKDEISILPSGTAAATNGQYQAYFPGDIYYGAIKVVTPTGQPILSRPLGLYYFDGSHVALISQLKSSLGQLIESNKVIYVDAFTNLHADLLYTYTRAGFEQDILLRQSPPPPEAFGMDSKKTRLQVFTEFFNQPDSIKSDGRLKDVDGTADTTIGFGGMKMVPGRAFYTATTNRVSDVGVPVYKNWLQVNGRSFLVEDLIYSSIQPQLDQLQASITPQKSKTMLALEKATSGRAIPFTRPIQESTKPIQLAKAERLKKDAVVLDYMLLSGTINNFTFQADTTYLIDTSYIELDGTTTVEGGAVIKISTNGASNFSINYFGNLVFNTTPYNPAIFTASDDNTVGETIAGSTGTPVGYYGTGPMIIYSSGNILIHDIRMSYLQYGFKLGAGASELDNIQAVNCASPFIQGQGGGNYYLTINNGLFYNIGSTCIDTNGGTQSLVGNNLTLHHCKLFTTIPTLALTNSLIVNVTNLMAGGTLATNKVTILTSEAGVFQTLGAGGHYLAASTYRDVGTTNISATALSMITGKTTFPPILYSNLVFLGASNFVNTALRDTNTPDLGYHYAPLDYITDGVTVSNSTLTITNPGTAIACYNQAGISLHNGGSITAVGTPLLPVVFARYQSIQELSLNLHGTNVTSGQNIAGAATTTNRPNGTFQFSKFTAPAFGGWHFNHNGSAAFKSLTLQNSELYGGTNNFSGATNVSTASLQNNLFYRSGIFASNSVTQTSLALSNNLIYGGTLALSKPATGSWYFYNNDVDSCSVATNSTITNGFNAFINSTVALSGTSNLISTNAIIYQTGALGIFYQPTNSPLLNAGGTTADQAALYHFTTTTNQAKETNSIVDIGYHYVAVDGTGKPLDANGNGVPDYLDQAPFITSQPTNITVATGGNGGFAVTAIGTAPLRYQWRFNVTNLLTGATNASLALTNVQSTNTGNYTVVVTNNFGSVTSLIATLTVSGGSAPSITSQPTNLTVIQSSNAAFNVTATGTALTYQWWFNATNKLTAATNTLLTLTNVQATNAGNYTVVITNAFGSVTSSIAVLTVWLPPSVTLTNPANGAVFTASTNISLGASVVTGSGSITQVQFFQGTNSLGIDTSAPYSLIWSNVAAGSYTLSAKVTDSNGLTATSSNITITVNGSSGISGMLAWWKAEGNALDSAGTNNGTTQGVMNYTNGEVAQAFSLNGVDSGFSATVGTLASGNTPHTIEGWFYINALPPNRTWLVLLGTPNAGSHHWLLQTDGTTQFGVWSGAQASPVLPVGSWVHLAVTFDGTTMSCYTNGQLQSAQSATFSFTSPVPITMGVPQGSENFFNGKIDEVSLYNRALSSNEVASIYNAGSAGKSSSSAPVITSQPTNVTVNQGGNATFTVAASGTSPLSYQWWFNTTNKLSAATNATLNLSNVQVTNAGNYLVVVTNSFGTVTSSNAMLTVLTPTPPSISITNPLYNSLFISGTNIRIDATTTPGTGSVVQVKFFQGTSLLGTITNSPYSLTWSNVAAGNYSLTAVASNSFGATGTSAVVNITVTSLFTSNNLALWLKADAITGVAGGSGISSWSDSSGRNNNGTQANNITNKPVWVTNALNGLPVVRFSAVSNQWFDLPSFFLSGTTNDELFVVLKVAVANPGATRALWQLGTGDYAAVGYPDLNGNIVEGAGSTGNRNLGKPAQPLNQYHVFEVAGQNGFWAAWINGVLLANDTGNGYGSAGAVALCRSGNNFFDGDVAEALVFSRTLTTAERLTVNTYLNAKYGLVPTTPSTPTNLIANAISSTQIGLTWSATLNGGATQISIERKIGIGGTYVAVSQVSGTLSYIDTNLVAGTTYYYRVRAINLNTWSGYSNETNAMTLAAGFGTDVPLSALRLWFKADAGVAQIGTNTALTFWPDQSGNANSGTQNNSLTNRPTWIANALNGLPVVRFTAGSNQWFDLPNSFLGGTTGDEICVVLKAAVVNPGATRPLWQLGTGDYAAVGYPDLNGNIVDGTGSSGNYSLGKPAQPLNQYHVFQAAGQNGFWAAWINGVLLGNNPGNGYGAAIPVALCRSGNNFFDGDVAEALVFSRTLTAAERDTVGNYLFVKYGLLQFATNAVLPSAPTNVQSVGLAPSQLQLQWAPTSTNAYSFHLERKLGVGGSYQDIGNTYSAVSNLVDVTAIATNLNYYRVRAHNLFGDAYSGDFSPPRVSVTNWPVAFVPNYTNTILAQALVASGSISNVQFFVGQQQFGFNSIGVANASPYQARWLPTFNGGGLLKVLATDTQGNSQYSAQYNLQVYLDSNGDGIADYLQILQGNDPLNPWTPPTINTNDHTAPIITLLIPTNAVIVP